MVVKRTPRFKRHYKERIAPNRVLVKEFVESLHLFLEDQSNPVLRDHALTGSMYGYRSFEIANDLLVVYLVVKEGIILYDVGSHIEVY